MHRAPGNKRDVAGRHVVQSAAGFHVEIPLQEEKRLILPMVDMPPRPYARLNDILENGDGPVCL